MLAPRRQFWLGIALLVAGAVILFGSLAPGLSSSPFFLALGVLVLAAGTLLVAVARRGRPV
ncbi:hypothetical protein DMJ13_16730 [halophilic archaeon]|nr:hypothetical protein DMJ13_16730 [halophilic archaeon]